MVRVNSTMLPLGTQAPDFSLADVTTGDTFTRDSALDGKSGLLVMFICRHCPFVKHLDAEIAAIAKDYGDRVGFAAISSNPADAYPEDAPESLAEQAAEHGFTFPYGYDEDQSIALAYTAACTPDFFLFDKDARLYYRGQLCDSRARTEGSPAVTGEDMRAALDSVIAGEPSPDVQKPSLGCNIKWREENIPEYFPPAG